MNGELAALICLATHGTEWLRGPGSVPAPDLAQTNSVFKHVSRIDFPPSRRPWPRKSVDVPDTSTWLTELRRRGVRRLWLRANGNAGSGELAPHLAASFSNGASWLLIADAGKSAVAWSAQWGHGKETARSKATWRIVFQEVGVFHGRAQRSPVAEAAAELDQHLRLARDFASRHSLSHWEKWFASALEASTEMPYNPDLVPDGYPPEATRLMSRAARSWVWGGMGSWNDLSFTDEAQEEYQRISADLYAADCRAFVAAANAHT